MLDLFLVKTCKMDVDLPGDDQTDGIHTTQDDNPDLEVGCNLLVVVLTVMFL